MKIFANSDKSNSDKTVRTFGQSFAKRREGSIQICSVTRFSEISPLSQNLNDFGKF